MSEVENNNSGQGQPHPGEPLESSMESVHSEGTLAPPTDSFDLEQTLQTIVKKKREAGIASRECGVVFEDLRVVGLGATVSHQPTLGSLFNPKAIMESIQAKRHPPVRDILNGFEGVVRPGEMLLVLGSPGSGCSTLLKTLTNQRREYHAVEGEVHYDSLTPEQMRMHFRGDLSYLPEDDVHFPTLTVGETLRFSTKTRTPELRPGQTRRAYQEGVVQTLLNVFGLSHTIKTPVGDAAIRGVSGGEKKRVSISEAFSTRAIIGAWDNATRGLDASTALEFVQALRLATDYGRLSSIVSIYQAAESLYQNFDKVCVIYEGKMAYFGPTDKARQYFIDLGYEPANRQTTPDFLVAVTDPFARIARADITNQPRNAEEFAQAFKNNDLGLLNRKDIDSYRSDFVDKPERAASYIRSAKDERAKSQRGNSAYTISIPMQIRAVMLRRIQILKGNWLLTFLNLLSYIFQAIIMGTVFIRLPVATSAYYSRGGVLFFALLFSALTAMAEIPALYAQRPIILRHEKAALYHPFIDAVALTLVDIPIMFFITSIYALIIYFAVRLQQSASQFFVFFLFLFSISITTRGWFRMVAAAFTVEALAQTVAGISVLAMSLYSGYSIPRPSMIGALKWISYINPIFYAFESVISNEFRTINGACSNLAPSGPGYQDVSLTNQVCTTPGSIPGQPTVNGARFIFLSFGFSYSHEWRNFGIIIAFTTGFLIALFILTEFNVNTAFQSSIVYFKRGSNSELIRDSSKSSVDEEKTPTGSIGVDEKVEHQKAEIEKATASAPSMHDIFSWQHMNYSVHISGEPDRTLLDDVSGYVAPGKLTALMGESGAGKTTLLNVLAQRVKTGVIRGDRFVNGLGLPGDFQAQTGYCQQTDTHEGTSTVREALLFSANLRQPPETPRAEKEAYVETVLKMCGLEKYADAAVASLNIEYRKRTTIGVELAAKPRLLLFLDEPTSGLDSQSAWAIVSFLRSLADSGQAILCTIHQPSAELFQVFDRLLLLKKGGETVYFGDLGSNSSTLLEYFERNGARHCDEVENPAEYMLEVIGAGATARIDVDWHGVWKNAPESQRLQEGLEQIHSEGRTRGQSVQETIRSEYATSWANQFYELLKRDASAHYRNPNYLMAKISLNIVGGLFIGFTFFKAHDSQQGTQNKLFAVFFSTILAVPLANQLQVPYINMRNIYEIRERPSRMYSWTALLASQIIVELPWNFFGTTLYFFCWYWTAGFDSSRAGYTYLGLGIIFPLYYTTVGQAVASMAPNAEIAALLFSFLFSFVLTFNGVLQPYALLGWWKWMYRLSPFTYFIEGLMGNIIGHSDITCSQVEFVTLQPPSGQTCGQYMTNFIESAGGFLTNSNANSDCQFCRYRTTDQYLEASFNIKYDHRWRNLGIMCGFIIFNIFAIFALTWFFRIRTRSIFSFFRRH